MGFGGRRIPASQAAPLLPNAHAGRCFVSCRSCIKRAKGIFFLIS
jgi:hypothetical protein